MAAQGMAPPEGLLGQPTQRPGEPLQQGLVPGGVGTGRPEFDQARFDLRALANEYREYPGLLRLIAIAEEQA
jgi:hypothetical protein